MEFGLRIHVKDCVRCHTCEVACKQQHELPTGADLIRIMEKTPRFEPVYCRHCMKPPCLEACPVQAISRQKGAVLLDPEKCIGCKSCLEACPFNAVGFDLERQVATKCNMCLQERVLQGEKPACATVCPSCCIKFGELRNMFARPWG